jgi:hypothetical protein
MANTKHPKVTAKPIGTLLSTLNYTRRSEPARIESGFRYDRMIQRGTGTQLSA